MADNRSALPSRKVLNMNHSGCTSKCTDPLMCHQFDQNRIENAFSRSIFVLFQVKQWENRGNAVILPLTQPAKFYLGHLTLGLFVVFACTKGHTFDCPHCPRQMLGNDVHFYLSDLLKGPQWPPVFFP